MVFRPDGTSAHVPQLVARRQDLQQRVAADFNPARARRIRAISQQIMRPRISGNGWEAHHFQTGWGFCQRQAGELLTEVGLKRHYKTPEPIKLLRIAPKR
jgi:hypothetical protein